MLTFLGFAFIAVLLFIINNRQVGLEKLLLDIKKKIGEGQNLEKGSTAGVKTETTTAPTQTPISSISSVFNNQTISTDEPDSSNIKGNFIPSEQHVPTAHSMPMNAVQTDENVQQYSTEKTLSHEPTTSSEETLGKTLGIIGIFAVLFGVAFFLKYAFDNNLISINGRLILGAGAGILALILGRLFKTKYENYGYTLSGGGIGILFVTAYTAHVLYDVISAPVAYICFGIITAISVVLSIMDGKMHMAVLGVSAGFLAPLLIFEGKDFVGLFSYILIINLGVATIAYVYKWQSLHYIAFIGTLISVSSWSYRIGDISSKYLFAVFVTAFFITFLVESIFHHVVRKENSEPGDIMFVTLNAAWYAAVIYPQLQVLIPNAVGWYIAAVGLLYLGLGYFAYTTNKEDKLLTITLPLIGLVFFTIAIPMQFHGSWITTAWFVEALALALIDYHLGGRRLFKFSLIIYSIGLFRMFATDVYYKGSAADFMPIVNNRFGVFAVAIIAGLIIAYVMHVSYKELPEKEQDERMMFPLVLAVLTQVLTLFIFSSEIHYYFKGKQALLGINSYDINNQINTTTAIVWALYAAFLTTIGFIYHSKVFRVFGLILFLLTAFRLFVGIWALGAIYRIVTFIIFGVIALAASFLYAKYKDRMTI